jgi:hypothetical protein
MNVLIGESDKTNSIVERKVHELDDNRNEMDMMRIGM